MEKILLVDDDQSARVTLSIALKSEGFAVEIVDTGEEALRRFSEGSYEWVISDVNMAGMSGIELVQKLQTLTPDIGIILISAYRSREELDNLEVQGFLEKPIDIQRLYHILRHREVPLGESFAGRVKRGAHGTGFSKLWPSGEPREIIRFHDDTEREAFEKRTLDFYELLEKKVEERTHELVEKQRNLEDAYFELRKTKLYLEHLIDASPGCVISTDTERNILSFNATAEKTFGFGREEVSGKRIEFVQRMKGGQTRETIYDATLERGRWVGEVEGIRKSGDVFPMSLVTSRVVDENKEVIAILHMARDITEEKEMEQQFHYAEKLSVIGQLAPKIAHEINNPLHVISANLQFAQMLMGKNEKLESCLARALGETDRIGRLTQQLMDVARPTELDIRELQVNDVLENAILFLKDVGEIKNLEVYKGFDQELLRIRGDQTQLEQVFRNLMHNASQAMEGMSTRVLTVSSRMSSDGKFVEVDVSDTGSGIPQENLERIFEPFFTTKEKGKGNGLGMSIVKGIVEQHQGFIQVRSSEGEGTEFTVCLPIESDNGDGKRGV
jgi:PAS domain S-box-containing protein